MSELQPWKVLVVDDDEGIHSITRMVFRGYAFENRPVLLLNAASAAQATDILNSDPDIAVAILDVVMETDQAGLELVNHIRNNLNNADMRIILRTGHPGFAPEADVIIDYDINDYLSKAELSASRLLTSVVVALRSYRDLQLKTPTHDASEQNTLQASSNVKGDSHSRLQGAQQLSEELNNQLLPLNKNMQRLLEIEHKAMARAVIDNVSDGIDAIAHVCQQFSKTRLNTVTHNKSTMISCEELLELHSEQYLKRAIGEGWIFDYHFQTAELAKKQYNKATLITVLSSAMELSISLAAGRDIKLSIESEQFNSVFDFKGKKADIPLTDWQELLRENLISLSSLAGVKVLEVSDQSLVRIAIE